MVPAWGPRPTLNTTLTGWLQGLLWTAGALALAVAVARAAAWSAFDTAMGRESATALVEWRNRDNAMLGIATAAEIVNLAVFVVVIVWTAKAHRASSGLWWGQRTWTSGWAVGGWFIPLAHMVIPKLVLTEIERIANAPRPNGVVANPRSGRVTALGWVWWVSFQVGWVLVTVGSAFTDRRDPWAREGLLRASYAMGTVGAAIIAVAGATGALHVRAIGRRLAPDGIAQRSWRRPPASVAADG
ncbi:MAG TPA: DUF4328 domain-containing protein [Ilumatobacter sp.]|nr:DUF4328 domain-containing protein [Ilumatobacter sp.]